MFANSNGQLLRVTPLSFSLKCNEQAEPVALNCSHISLLRVVRCLKQWVRESVCLVCDCRYFRRCRCQKFDTVNVFVRHYEIIWFNFTFLHFLPSDLFNALIHCHAPEVVKHICTFGLFEV